MKLIKLFIIPILFLMPVTVYTQTLQITVDPDHESFDLYTIPLSQTTLKVLQGSILINDKEISNPVTWSYSEWVNRVATIEREENLKLSLFDPYGNRLMSRTLEFFDPFDQTLKVYPIGDGRTILRDNVANFTFLNVKGETLYSVSNSSQSVEGERESRLAMDETGRSVVLYNPAISYGNTTGSRAKIVLAENDEYQFFNHTEMQIKELKISKTGSFITLLATDDEWIEVLLFDRFGNELYRYRTEDSLQGVHLSPNGDYITKFTSGRVQVFNTLTGEVAGSTSSRSSVMDAVYFPQEETILILGGGISGQRLSDPSITAVHLGRRQIIRENIGESLSITPFGAITIEREMSGRYLIRGMNKHLFVTANF